MWSNVKLNITSSNDIKESNLMHTINQKVYTLTMLGWTQRKFEDEKAIFFILRYINHNVRALKRKNNKRFRNSDKEKGK